MDNTLIELEKHTKQLVDAFQSLKQTHVQLNIKHLALQAQHEHLRDHVQQIITKIQSTIIQLKAVGQAHE